MDIELLRADINSLKVDAIINPASASKPVAEFGSVPVGHAVVTSGGNVLCKFVIHAIVPRLGDGDEDTKLRNAMWAALKRAEELAIASVAMPPVPALFGFEAGRCSRVMVSTALDFRPHARSLQRVVFCAFGEDAYCELRRAIEEAHGLIPAGQIFVIGDSHIGLSEGSEAPILSWLDRLAALQPRALYLNGDLFHYLIANPKFYTTSVQKVFARFRELRDGGLPIHYVEGNRDFFLRGSFVEESVSDVAMEYAVDAGQRKYLIIHGDMINDRDLPYRFWRFASKNAASRFSLRFIPKKIARKFVDRVEARLSDSNFKHKSQLPIERMEAYGRTRGAEGFTHVVFGHFHEKLVLPGPATVTVLPAWYETGEAMVIDPETGEFSWVRI